MILKHIEAVKEAYEKFIEEWRRRKQA